MSERALIKLTKALGEKQEGVTQYALVLKHGTHFHVNVVNNVKGQSTHVVPPDEIGEVVGKLIGDGISILSVPVTVPPVPRNPPPPPGMPLDVYVKLIRAVTEVGTEIELSGFVQVLLNQQTK